MGLISKKPVVDLPNIDNEFTVINLVIDTTFTSSGRMALVTKPVDIVWGKPHIRFAMEKRGFYCQGWIGQEDSVASLFDLPLSDECEVTMVIGRHGIYMLDPSCEIVGAFPKPEWCQGHDKLYLILYGQASRPGEEVSYLYKSISIITGWSEEMATSHD